MSPLFYLDNSPVVFWLPYHQFQMQQHCSQDYDMQTLKLQVLRQYQEDSEWAYELSGMTLLLEYPLEPEEILIWFL